MGTEIEKAITKKLIDESGIGNILSIPFERKKILNSFKTENEIALKKAIIDSTALNFEQKIMLNGVLDKSLNKFYRQLKVLDIAIDQMEPDADISNLDEEWLLDYFDKISNISKESSQIIWAKLLAAATSDKRICSKSLLNTLFLMGTEEVTDFLNLCQYCFSELGESGKSKHIISHPIIYFSKGVKTYEHHQISTLRLNKLQNLGLIEVDFKSEYIFVQKSMKLIYKNKVIQLFSDKKIKIGNVRFTYEGFLLYQMTEKMYNSEILEYTIEIWLRRGYEVYMNDRKLKGNTI